MAKKLLIVESREKAQKIQGYLGSDFVVKTCFGHVCDLPSKEYGVDRTTWDESYAVENEFAKKTLGGLRKVIREQAIEHVFLGTDPDREGEAIAWHLARELKLPKGKHSRVSWNDFTRATVQRGLDNPGPINMPMVEAQRSRRILDRIVGWDVSSGICWPAGAKAAGRVQSPTLHILCERERAIRDFVSVPYWVVTARYQEGFEAFVAGDEASGPQDHSAAQEGAEESASESDGRRSVMRRFASREEADTAANTSRTSAHVVQGMTQRDAPRKPPQPFKTSTLQQEASRKLGLDSSAAMELAQKLFDNGHITYHRTDSTRLSDEAVTLGRAYIQARHPEVLAATAPRAQKGDQDAHEAIRPTDLSTPLSRIPAEARDLYTLICARFLSALSKPAIFAKTEIDISAGDVRWCAQGSVLKEPGFLVFWAAYTRDDETALPQVVDGQTLSVESIEVGDRKTNPPPRYDQGGLVAKMEAVGIGRPATYAETIRRLLKHGYVEEVAGGRGKKYLVPTDHGMDLDGLLSAAFATLTSPEYTASMEAALDTIAASRQKRVPYLESWHSEFATLLDTAKISARAYATTHGMKPIARGGAETSDITCDRCGNTQYLIHTNSKTKKPFLACPDKECGFTRDVSAAVKPAACPTCEGSLVERFTKKSKGKSANSFFSCAKGCGYTANADGNQSAYRREATDKTCPRCEKNTLTAMIEVADPTKGFYGCPDRKKCGFSLPLGSRRHKVDCEKCGGMMLEKFGRKGGRYFECAKCSDKRWAQEGE